MQLVPIRIKIKLKTPTQPTEGRMDYPNFNGLPAPVRDGQDWAVFIERFGALHYDKVGGFGVSDVQSPQPDVQFAAVLVPAIFAGAAVKAFPERVNFLTEKEFTDFYNDRAHVHEPAGKIDKEVLEGLRAKYGIASEQKIAAQADWDQADKDALDPDHPAQGIRANPSKTYDRFKKRLGFTITTMS